MTITVYDDDNDDDGDDQGWWDYEKSTKVHLLLLTSSSWHLTILNYYFKYTVLYLLLYNYKLSTNTTYSCKDEK